MAQNSTPYDYVAYIDESGDPGLNRVKPRSEHGSSEWLIISAALVPADLEDSIKDWIHEMMAAMNSRQLTDIHFQKLNPSKKSLLCSMLAQKHVRLFCVISNKQNMQGYQNPYASQIPSDNWFYCWLTRVLLERLTHFVANTSVRKYGEKRRVKLEFSERGGLSYSQMSAYYEWINIKSVGGKIPLYLPWGSVDFDVLHRNLFKVYSHRERAGLKLPDIVASAFFKAVDVCDTRACDPQFAKLLKPKMAMAPGSKQILGYGVKLMPNWRTLDQFNVPAEQREILQFYGYPGQWWHK